ncbi:MAG: hypothetical protein WD872_05725 [Pirellulaceae bacterium]
MLETLPRSARSRSCGDRFARFTPLLDQLERPLVFRGGDANLTRYVGNSPTNATDPSGLFSLENVLEILNSTPEGRRAIRNINASGAEVHQSEYIRSYRRRRKDECSPWGEWKVRNWGAMTTRDKGRIVIHIPEGYTDEQAAFFIVHEAAHAIGGDEVAAYTAETQFAIEYEGARKLARKGLIVCDDKGNMSIDQNALKKFIEDTYPGWYKPDPLEQYMEDEKTKRRKIDYGKEKKIGPFKLTPM